MEVVYSQQALEDIDYWKNSGNKKIQQKIQVLINDIRQTPFSGLCKPEPLKYELSGKWSRRIDKGNRIVYTIEGDSVRIYSLKGHYLLP